MGLAKRIPWVSVMLLRRVCVHLWVWLAMIYLASVGYTGVCYVGIKGWRVSFNLSVGGESAGFCYHFSGTRLADLGDLAGGTCADTVHGLIFLGTTYRLTHFTDNGRKVVLGQVMVML
jgi:hypothetical protein